jgi:hypothetical protein
MGGYTWRTDTANFDRQCLFPAPGTLRDLHVDLDEAPGGSGSYTFDIDAGDLQFDIDDPDEVGNSGSKTHSVSSGDDIRISVSPTGPTNSPQAKWGFNFQPDDQTESSCVCGSDNLMNGTATEFNQIVGTGIAWNASESGKLSITQLCRIKNFYVELDQIPSINKEWTFTIMKNGSATDLQVVIADSATTGNNTDDVIEYDDFDNLSLRAEPTSVGAPSNGRAIWGFTVEAVYPFMDSQMMMGMGV